eukprot:s7745_g2.t1
MSRHAVEHMSKYNVQYLVELGIDFPIYLGAMADRPCCGLSLSLEGDVNDDWAKFKEGLSEDEAEEKSSEASSSKSQKQKRGKKNKGKTAKAKAKAKGKSKKSKNPPNQNAWKKCKGCGKWLEMKDFNDQQSKCKGCNNDVRALARLAERQNCKEDLSQMERDDPKQHAALMKAYSKERKQTLKSGEKVRFSIAQFKLTYKSSTGIRSAAEGEMMWQGEWFEEAKKAKHGYLSQTEADEMWQKWLSTPTHPRDNHGPRNRLRLWVKVRDVLSYFDEVGRHKELSKEEKLGKNPSQATVEARMKFVAGEQEGMEQHEMDDLAKKRKRPVSC